MFQASLCRRSIRRRPFSSPSVCRVLRSRRPHCGDCLVFSHTVSAILRDGQYFRDTRQDRRRNLTRQRGENSEHKARNFQETYARMLSAGSFCVRKTRELLRRRRPSETDVYMLSCKTSQVIVCLKLVPSFVQRAEDGTTHHPLLDRRALGYLRRLAVKLSGRRPSPRNTLSGCTLPIAFI